MAEEHPTTEPTTRDVLVQIDRRLTRVEDDIRSFDNKVDNKFEMLPKEINTRFQWVTGILLASWISVMGTLLIK